MTPARITALLLAALLGAGCFGSEPTPTTTPKRDDKVEPSVIVDPVALATTAPGEAPAWKVGDAWAFSPIGTGGAEPGFLVVTSADADTYTLEPTSPSLAAFDAMYDVSFVGKIRAKDLAGHQQGQPIQFFSFPLADGKTWTTTWDGREIALSAKASAKGFDIVGTADGEPFVTYDYDPALRWWSTLEFAGGYGIRVSRVFEEWTGEIATAQAKIVLESGPTAPALSGGAGSFTVEEGQTFLQLTVSGGGTLWLRAFALFDPANHPYMLKDVSNLQLSEGVGESSSYFYQEQLPATAGTWHVVDPVLHSADAAGNVLVHQVLTGTRAFP